MQMKRLIDIPRRLSRKAFAAGLAATLLIVSAALAFNLLPAQAQAADPPAAPTGLSASGVSSDSVTLNWDDPGDSSITGHQVLRRSRDGSEYGDGEGAAEFAVIQDDTGSSAATYTDRSVTARTRYVYRVKAINPSGTSGQSSYLNVETPEVAEVPAAPTGLAVQSATHESVTLNWYDPSDSSITGHQVLRRSRDGDEYGDGEGAKEFEVIADDTGSPATSYIDASVTPRTRYVYRVKLRNSGGLSEWSGSLNVETPEAPASLEAQLCQDGYVPPTPTDVAVMAVPLVVASTIDDYFVLYVRHQMNADTSVDIPVSVILGEAGTTTLVDNLEALPADRYRVEKYLATDPADIDGDCMDDITELEDLGAKNPTTPGPAINLNDGTVAIPDRATFEALSYQGTDVIVEFHLTDLEYVKFYMFDMDTDHPSVYLMNTETHRLHASFMIATNLGREFPYRPQSDMRGEIVYHPNVPAPNGSLGVYRYAFEPWDSHSFYPVAYSYEILAAAMPLLENNLFYYPMPAFALPLYRQEQARYDNSRVNILLSEDIIPYDDFIPLNEAEGYGFLRTMSLDERPNPRDLVIYTSLPNDLPHVAGIITTVPQTPLSHVNLRAVQNGVPNAFIRDALEDTSIDSLLDSPVYYQVSSTGYTIRAATLEEVNAHHDVTRPTQTQTPERDLSVTEITALGEVEFDDWTAFGVKAANVAELRTLDFPDGTVPDGFAVPFYFYDEFMKANDFYSDIQAMMTVEGFATDFDTQESELKNLRKKIKKGTTPGAIITALEEMHKEFPEGTSLRYRSSTNNEDLRDFNGAGLYDSKTQDPEETEEDGIDKSIKGVWASLWNFRAFSERDFHRIGHNAAAMGVLVHPNYSDELANGVAVSFDPINGADGTYYINSQLGEDLITNPEAHSVPEELLLAGDGTYTILATSSLTEDGHLLMTDAQISQLRRYLKTIHGHFEELYGIEDGEQFAIDIEFKITAENILAIKQARPWVFSADQSTTPTDDPPLVTGVPVISGTAQVGETLTADTSGITDPDGLDNATFRYQWVRHIESTDTDIGDATAPTYTLVEDDEGKALRVRVGFTDDAGNEETLTSPATAPVRHPGDAVAWEGELTAGQEAGIIPVMSGYSSFGDLGGILSPDTFVLDETTYRVQFLVHVSGGLWLGMTGELPVDFTLQVGDSAHRGSESKVPRAISLGAYWWASAPPGWPADGPVQVSLTVHPDVPLGDRQKAPVAGYFRDAPAEHGGDEDFSFRIYFTELVSTTAGALRDHVLAVTGGAVSGVEAVGDDGRIWAVSVTPESADAVTIEIEAGLDCELSGAVCTADGRRLFNRMELDVAGPPPAADGPEPDGQNNPATGPPAIRGQARVGATLRVSLSALDDADGLSGAVFAYQWLADDAEIQGATDSTHAVDAGQEGKIIRVRVSFTDDAGNEETLHSAATAAVGVSELHDRPYNLQATVAEGAITLTWQDPNTHPSHGSYHILRHRPELGEDRGLVYVEYTPSTDRTFTDSAVEPGVLYVYAVKAVKDYSGFLGPASNPVEVRMPPGEGGEAPNSPATGVPTISGTAQVGETLTVDTSGISDPDGLESATFSYNWFASDNSGIGLSLGAGIHPTYVVQSRSEGKNIEVVVAFTDDAGNPEGPRSEYTATVTAAANPRVPEAPTYRRVDPPLSVSPQGSGELEVTWSMPGYPYGDGGSAITSRKVQWKEASGSWDNDADVSEEVVLGHCWVCRYTITGLTNGVAYTVRVFVTNAIGDSPPSDELTSTPTDGTAFTLSGITRANYPEDERLPVAVYTVTGAQAAITWSLSGGDSEEFSISTGGDLRFKSLPSFENPTDADRDNQYRVTIQASDGTNTATLQVVVVVNSRGRPIINGNAQVGQTLTADTSGITDADGLYNPNFTYQWIANDGNTDSEIAGATASTYTLTDSEEGKTIKVRVSFTDYPGNEESLTSEATAAVAADPTDTGPLTGFTLWDASDQTELAQLADGGALSMDDPDSGSYGIRVEFEANAEIGSVRLELTGAKPVTKTESMAPYSLYGDDADGLNGEPLPVGEYTLRATAYSERGGNGDELGSLEVSFTVTDGSPQPPPNSPATGLPTISGTGQVGETLTVDTNDIHDPDGTGDAVFTYQWLSEETEIVGATDDSYTLTDADEGNRIRVRVSFTDDEGNPETLTSEATDTVAGRPPEPLTASLENTPTSHDGETAFTFELRFSKEPDPDFSYKTLRDHAFTVTGGAVKKAQRLDKPSNILWRITVEPDSSADVTVILPVTTDCGDQGAICTEDGRKLSNRLELTVNGPGG